MFKPFVEPIEGINVKQTVLLQKISPNLHVIPWDFNRELVHSHTTVEL